MMIPEKILATNHFNKVVYKIWDCWRV